VYVSIGDGVECEKMDHVITNCAFFNKKSVKNGKGGAIYFSSNPSGNIAHLTIQNSIFWENSAVQGGGNDIYAENQNVNPVILGNCFYQGTETIN
jgi:hypothetical protein